METNIQIFTSENFGEIRTCQVNNQIMFVGKDVATALGYSNSQKAIRDHVDDDDKLTERFVLSGQIRSVIIINESGLYSLILSSKLPQAKAFKRWVTSEVLPQIRMTGGYIPTHDAEGNQLSDEQILHLADDIVARTLQMKNERMDDCLTATEVARLLGWDAKLLNEVLEDMGIQRRRGGRWVLADELSGLGLTEDRHFCCYSLRGKRRSNTYMTWTAKGVSYLGKRLDVATVLNARAVVSPCAGLPTT